MAGLRDAALICVAHALLAGAAAWFWLGLIGAKRGEFDAIVCAAPALLATGLSFSSQVDCRQYVVRLLACSAMLPTLLMMWAGSQDAVADRIHIPGAGLDGPQLAVFQRLRGD